MGLFFLFFVTIDVFPSDSARPNIVVIYADDIGYGDLGCYGGIGAETPQIDQFAESGLRFLSGYSTAATCTPSRYSLLTGEYAFRNKEAEILPGNAPLIIDPAKPTIASFLSDHGYATALVGKWHLGLGAADEPLDWNGLIKPGPREVGFEYSFNMAATADRVPSVYIENGRVIGLEESDPLQVSYAEQVGDEPTGISHAEMLRWKADKQHSGTIINGISRIGFMTGGNTARFRDEDMLDTYVTKAIEFIKKPKEKPFFLYFAPNENHVPRAVHERFQGQSELGPRGDALVAFDWGVGALIDTLKEQGILENTLVILTSDNGPILFDGYLDEAIEKQGEHLAGGPWRGGKYSRWEGGTRMPFIASWPGRIQPGISEALVSHVDLFASMASLAGLTMPADGGPDSLNVLPALLGDSSLGRDYVIQEGWKQLAIRKGNWKYIAPGKITDRGGYDEWKETKVGEPGLLFHLAEDPQERRNLAEKYPHVVSELREIIEQEKSGAQNSAKMEEALAVDAWLAPVEKVTDVVCNPPEGISFSSTKNGGWSLEGSMPKHSATVVLRPEQGTWDMSDFSYFRVDMVNKGSGLVWVRGRLDNVGAEDWDKSTPTQAFLMPGERATLGFAYPRAAALDDSPAVFASQSGKPNAHRSHWKPFDPANVIACRLQIQSTVGDLALEDIELSLAQPYGAEANAGLLELPYLDEFGQVRQLDWSGKVKRSDELVARQEAEANSAKDEGPKTFNQYGGWAVGPQLEATGFFRREKVDEKWWLVDPEGRLFFSHGANSIGFAQRTPLQGRKELFAWVPAKDDELMKDVLAKGKLHFVQANLARIYGADWRSSANARVHQRLRQWGMNTLGAWSDTELVQDRKTPYTAILHMGGDWSPLGHGVSDPFSEAFSKALVKGLGKLLGPDRKDPLCVGVFIDNEVDWTEKFVHHTFEARLKQPARLKAIEFLQNKYGAIASLNTAWETSYPDWDAIRELPEEESDSLQTDLVELARMISGAYYKGCRDAMREILPDHLYLGSRMHKAPREVFEEAAKYVDVLSLNSYENLSGSKVPGGIDVPCMDTEFHFAAPDRGIPGTGMLPIGDQLQRSRAYVAYVVSGLRHPKMVGTHWFAYTDQSAAGRPGENHQIGFVDVTDSPYVEITEASRIMAEQMYEIGSDKERSLLAVLESLWSEEAEPEFAYQVHHGKEVTVEEVDGAHAIEGKGTFKLTLKPQTGEAWDLNAVSVLGLPCNNTGDSDLVIDLILRNEGATGWSNSSVGRTVVKAGENLSLASVLWRSADYSATDPAYLRMSGLPNGRFRHWHTFNPAKVKDLVLTVSGKGDHSFSLGDIFPKKKMDDALLGVFPFIDEYGQYILGDMADKVVSDEDFVEAISAEVTLEKSLGEPANFTQYGGWKEGPRYDATGYFRTEKVDGKWWFIDPEGYLFWSFGVNCAGVDYAGQTPVERNPLIFKALPAEQDAELGQFHIKIDVEENYDLLEDVPHYDFTRANLFKKYGADWEAKQIEQDLQRLKYCGINTIGAWSDASLATRREVPYVAMLHYRYAFAGPKLPDPFDPKTREELRTAIAEYPVPFKDDPWCLGAFVSNELHWHNDARTMVAGILGYETVGSAARKVFKDWLEKKYSSLDEFNAAWKTTFVSWDDLLTTTSPDVFKAADSADCAALTTLFAEASFKLVHDELTAYAPKVLYLGARMNAAGKEVVKAAAKYADVLSANLYSYSPNVGPFGSVDKPVLISEFHFANVGGNNLGSGLRSAQDAVQQGRLLTTYINEAVKQRQIVGAHWYQWRDQPVGGRFDGENYDVGFFDVADNPNVELIRAAATCGKNLYQSIKK